MVYRVKQLWWAVTAAPLSPDDDARVRAILNSAEYALFQTFTYNDQTHTIRILNLLESAGHTHPDLLTAALLHDIGKTAVKLTILDRCIVVAGAFRSEKWGRANETVTLDEAADWRRPFIVKHHHADWSADLCAPCGTTPLALTLIRRHQDIIPADDTSHTAHLLRALQWADDQS